MIFFLTTICQLGNFYKFSIQSIAYSNDINYKVFQVIPSSLSQRTFIVSVKLSENSCVKARLVRNAHMNYAKRVAEWQRKRVSGGTVKRVIRHFSSLTFSRYFSTRELPLNLTDTIKVLFVTKMAELLETSCICDLFSV